MGILNNTILIFLLWICNAIDLHAQCEDLFYNGVKNIDSILEENKINKTQELVITNNEVIIFTKLINELYPKRNSFKQNFSHAIVTTTEEMEAFSSFLSENTDETLKKLNELYDETFCKSKYSKIDFDDKRLFHAALFHFLDRNFGRDFLDFDSICKYHFERIEGGELYEKKYKIMPSGNDYVFILTLLGITKDAYNWNHHLLLIDEYSLTMFRTSCMRHYYDPDIQMQFFESLCENRLVYDVYME